MRPTLRLVLPSRRRLITSIVNQASPYTNRHLCITRVCASATGGLLVKTNKRRAVRGARSEARGAGCSVRDERGGRGAGGPAHSLAAPEGICRRHPRASFTMFQPPAQCRVPHERVAVSQCRCMELGRSYMLDISCTHNITQLVCCGSYWEYCGYCPRTPTYVST